jgi:hypothetical protein
MQAVKNQVVWGHTRTLFLGSALLFLINNFFGFDNALTVGPLPRWQALIHLHAGSIGWITLSLIGIAVWLFTGERDVSESYARGVRTLTRVAVPVFGAYIISFGLAFSLRGFFVLLPIFGTASMLLIWVAAIFSLRQLRHQPVVTTVHVLAAGGLLVAAVGATMGVMLGLERVIGQFLPIVGEDRVGVHAGMMDTYIIIVAGAIVEWFVSKDPGGRRTWAGVAQGVAWSVAAILVPVAYLTNALAVLLPMFVLLLFVGLVIFMVRIGWRGLTTNPLSSGPKPWAFFGTFWMVVFVGMFIWAATAFVEDFSLAPSWFFAVFVHAAFVGTMTNLLLGVYSARTQESRSVMAWGEPAARWLINLGLLAFFALKITSDSRLGAIVMGIGVVLGVFTMIRRLLASGQPIAVRGKAAPATGAD